MCDKHIAGKTADGTTTYSYEQVSSPVVKFQSQPSTVEAPGAPPMHRTLVQVDGAGNRWEVRPLPQHPPHLNPHRPAPRPPPIHPSTSRPKPASVHLSLTQGSPAAVDGTLLIAPRRAHASQVPPLATVTLLSMHPRGSWGAFDAARVERVLYVVSVEWRASSPPPAVDADGKEGAQSSMADGTAMPAVAVGQLPPAAAATAAAAAGGEAVEIS